MNRIELQEALDARGVDPFDYYIVGVSEGGLRGGGELVLKPDGSRWVVYTTERGEDFNHKYFENEDAAAHYLFEQAIWKPPVGRPPTPEETERARLIQERQLARRRDWLRGQGRDPDTGLPVDS